MTHTVEQPGLHAHSWNPEDDLMKRYQVEVCTNPKLGWTAVSSFDGFSDSLRDASNRSARVTGRHTFTVFRVVDTHAHNKVMCEVVQENHPV